MGRSKMLIGDIEILPVPDGTGHLVADEVLHKPDSTDPWACHSEHLDEQGRLVLTMGGFLVRTADRTVLVDAGIGGINTDKYAGGGLLDSLQSYGVTPSDVTDVVFTHLHFDHVGWATRNGKVVFPNATYRVHRDDWAHFVEAPDADAKAVRKLSPIINHLDLFDTETTIAPGLDARPTPGHTPGSTTFIVSGGRQRALLIGDVAHSVLELEDPEWEATFDVDPVAARAMREMLVGETIDTDTLVVPAHLPGLAFGRLITISAGRSWIPVPWEGENR